MALQFKHMCFRVLHVVFTRVHIYIYISIYLSYVYIYMYIYKYVIYTYMCIYTEVWCLQSGDFLHTLSSLHINRHIHVCVIKYIYIYIRVVCMFGKICIVCMVVLFANICIDIHVYVFNCTYSVYIYIYIYIYIYEYMYILLRTHILPMLYPYGSGIGWNHGLTQADALLLHSPLDRWGVVLQPISGIPSGFDMGMGQN